MVAKSIAQNETMVETIACWYLLGPGFLRRCRISSIAGVLLVQFSCEIKGSGRPNSLIIHQGHLFSQKDPFVCRQLPSKGWLGAECPIYSLFKNQGFKFESKPPTLWLVRPKDGLGPKKAEKKTGPFRLRVTPV